MLELEDGPAYLVIHAQLLGVIKSYASWARRGTSRRDHGLLLKSFWTPHSSQTFIWNTLTSLFSDPWTHNVTGVVLLWEPSLREGGYSGILHLHSSSFPPLNANLFLYTQHNLPFIDYIKQVHTFSNCEILPMCQLMSILSVCYLHVFDPWFV